MRLWDFCASDFSQFGQDGIIQKIESIIKPVPFFVEAGSSGDDFNYGNTPALRGRGWNGILIDKNPGNKQYHVHEIKLSASNVESTLKRLNCPKHFGLLSLDIDGQDYWVLKAIENYIFDILIVEFNHYVLPEIKISIPQSEEFNYADNNFFGASAGAYLSLMNSRGYDLVSICITDMIFVRREKLKGFEIENINNIVALDYAKVFQWVPQWQRERVMNIGAWVNV